MNVPARVASNAVAVPEGDLIRVLQSSLYPGAKDDSVRLVLSWCTATGRDPMKKPVHIVPMSVKVGDNKWEMRDVLMPGIGTYRSDAAATGQYAGKGEPEFGPETTRTLGDVEVTYPAWCKVTVQRLVGSSVRSFTAVEFWLENYATAGRNTQAPNAMWRKRPYGQIAKCAESQALRMAFPDETGDTNTSDEMEGKSFDGTTIDITANTQRQPTQIRHSEPIPDMGAPSESRRTPVQRLRDTLHVARNRDDVAAAAGIPAIHEALNADGNDAVKKEMKTMLDQAWAKFAPPAEPDEPRQPGEDE